MSFIYKKSQSTNRRQLIMSFDFSNIACFPSENLPTAHENKKKMAEAEDYKHFFL